MALQFASIFLAEEMIIRQEVLFYQKLYSSDFVFGNGPLNSNEWLFQIDCVVKDMVANLVGQKGSDH